GNRVEEVGDEPDRMVEAAIPVCEERSREGDREADRDGDAGELQVLEKSRLERVAPVVLHPAPAERVVLGLALRPRSEVRYDGGVREECRHSSASSRPTRSTAIWPSGSPSAPTTTRGSAPSLIISERASRSVIEPGARGPSGGVPSSGSRSISESRRSA